MITKLLPMLIIINSHNTISIYSQKAKLFHRSIMYAVVIISLSSMRNGIQVGHAEKYKNKLGMSQAQAIHI